jgi:uncharacterized UPF0160 family protein
MTPKKLVTHSGKFHADDVFATATLKKVFGDIEVVRSRESEAMDAGDIVYDVGLVYDTAINRYDHHQPGGAGFRDNGIPYAAFGLIWKHFGKQLCSSEAVWKAVDERLVERVDATDTGYASLASYTVPTLEHYTLDTIAGAFNPTWTESYEQSFEYFMEYVAFAERLLEREIIRAEAFVHGKEKVAQAYNDAPNKEIIILDRGYPWREVLVSHPEPKFVVFPEVNTNRFMVQAVHQSLAGFETRARFPEAWGGLVDAALSQASGIPGSCFCHTAGFLAVNETLEGAIALAEKALVQA